IDRKARPPAISASATSATIQSFSPVNGSVPLASRAVAPRTPPAGFFAGRVSVACAPRTPPAFGDAAVVFPVPAVVPFVAVAVAGAAVPVASAIPAAAAAMRASADAQFALLGVNVDVTTVVGTAVSPLCLP